jgi:predicted RNA-binding Zn-ribbon protein involved in translation (DUF1610 family)
MYSDAWKLSLKTLCIAILLLITVTVTPDYLLPRELGLVLFIAGTGAISIYMRVLARRFPCPACGQTIFSKWGIPSFFPTSKCSKCGHRFTRHQS